MSMTNEPLEQALVAAALELSGATMAHAFSIPVPNTNPPLYVSLHEGAVQLLLPSGVGIPPALLTQESADRLMPTYGEVPWADLEAAIAAANGAPKTFSDQHHIGHQQAPINMNSLNRIVSMFIRRTRGVASVPTWLLPDDMQALQRFYETSEDSQPYDMPKERMVRLAELGVVQKHGRATYSMTAFGQHVLDLLPDGWPRLPLKTHADHDAYTNAQIDAAAGVGIPVAGPDMDAAWQAFQTFPIDHAEDSDEQQRKAVEAAVRAAHGVKEVGNAQD